MIQSKAIDVVKSFSKKEISEFSKYLDSPFLNSNKNLVKLFSGLKKFYPFFDSSKLTKETLYRTVYPGKQFDDRKLRKLFSDLYKETERFIVISAADKNEIVFNKLLLDEFDSRKIDNLFISKIEQYNLYLDDTYYNTDNLHYDYFLEKHLAEWKKVMFHLERGMQQKIALNIYKRTEYLIFYFLSDLFLSFQDNLSNKSRFNTRANVDLGSEFLKNFNINAMFEYILKNDFASKNVLNAYYLAFLAFRNFENEKYYYDFKEYVVKNIGQFNEGTKRTVVINLINYCARKKGLSKERKIRQELNDNYGLYISQRLYRLSGENYFRSDIFLNIISNYFELGKVKESSEFLENNIDVIQPSHRKNIKALCRSLIEFEKGNFGQSLRESSMIKTNYYLYKYRIKYLNLKNHYELKNYDIAKESLNSFRKYIINDENLTDILRSKTNEFVNNYNILWKYYEKRPPEADIKKAVKCLEEISPIPESKWLICKFKELLKK
ncbi:MAG: hypothetical protein J0M37_05740 [Ignavibacteria bacterium]|nr:hypothetical protein [Ignavibacteria bacterium]